MRQHFNFNAKSAGFIKAIIIIVIALVALGFFGYNLREIVASPSVRDNLLYVWELLVKLWGLLLTPLSWVWENIVIKLVWNNLQTLLNK